MQMKRGGIDLFPRRLFRWMIRVKSSIITNSYSLPVTVNFEYVPQHDPHPYTKAWFQSYGEKVIESKTGWGTGNGKDDGMTSLLSKYWVLGILLGKHYPCKSTRSAEDAEQICCCDRRWTAFLSDSSFAKYLFRLWKLCTWSMALFLYLIKPTPSFVRMFYSATRVYNLLSAYDIVQIGKCTN